MGTRHTDFTGRRVLVTGASGFLGTHLVAQLRAAGAHVATLLTAWEPDSILMRSKLIDELTVRLGGVEDHAVVDELIRDVGIDTVFHLAATATTSAAHQSPLRTFEVNVRGTYNVLEACRARDVARVVIASSDKAYGAGPALPYTEDMPMAGTAPYDVSKSCADLIARSYHASYGLPVAVGRYGNVFGGGDLHWSRLIPGTIRRVLHGERPVVRAPVKGDFTRDFLYVGDTVDSYFAMAAGLDAGIAAGEAFNFAMGHTWTPLTIVREIQRLLGRKDLAPVMLPAEPGEISRQHISNDKAAHRLGWTPTHTLTEGLEETIDWYRRHLGMRTPALAS